MELGKFNIVQTPFVVAPAIINDKGPFDFVIDTGAGTTMATEETAMYFVLQNIETKDAMGIGGTNLQVRLGHVETISVGEARVENAKVAVMKSLPKCVGQGVVGYDFLRRFVMTIDYPLKKFSLASSNDGSNRNA